MDKSRLSCCHWLTDSGLVYDMHRRHLKTSIVYCSHWLICQPTNLTNKFCRPGSRIDSSVRFVVSDKLASVNSSLVDWYMLCAGSIWGASRYQLGVHSVLRATEPEQQCVHARRLRQGTCRCWGRRWVRERFQEILHHSVTLCTVFMHVYTCNWGLQAACLAAVSWASRRLPSVWDCVVFVSVCISLCVSVLLLACVRCVNWPVTVLSSSSSALLTRWWSAAQSLSFYTVRVPTPPGKSWIFSWKFQDLESPGKSLWSWKVLEIKA